MLGLPLPPAGSLIWLTVSWLAVWRITALLVYDRGPFDVLTRIRAVLVRGGLQQMILCFHCTAVWVALLLIGLLFEWRWLSLVVAVAAAGAASITERWLTRSAGEATEETDE